jgi:ligand-binding sensor domain-containing protein/two-component sensor histidine kinase
MFKKSVYIFILASLNLVLGKEVPYFKIEHLSIEQGLSQNTVRSIIQDKQGFLWFATEDGLNRYDGYRLKVYRHNQLDSNSISDNFIWILYENKKGELWIGTNNGGLNRFDKENERFVQYKSDSSDPFSISNNNIRAISEDENGTLWVGTEGGGLNKFDSRLNHFIRINNLVTNGFFPYNIFSIIENDKESLWLGTDRGLVKFLKNKNQFFNYGISSTNLNNSINTLYKDNDGIIWVGTVAGVYQFNPAINKFYKYKPLSSEFNGIVNVEINSITKDKTGCLWIGSAGLGILLIENNSVNALSHSSSNISSLSSDHITTIAEDNMGIIWVGTTEGGINKIDRKENKFIHYKHDPFNSNSLSYSTIRAIYEDYDGTLWIGTLEGGLNRLDRKRNLYSHFKNNPQIASSLSDNTVTSIFRTKRGELWIGTWGGGLEKAEFDRSGKVILGFKHFKNNNYDQQSINSNIVQAIYEDTKGRLWIGTGLGLDLFDRRNNTFIHFTNRANNSNTISDNRIQSNCILEDSAGNLWIGTWNGLNKMILPKGSENSGIDDSKVSFERYFWEPNNINSLSNSRIISIYEDKNKVLWIGTYGGGLNKIFTNKKTGEKIIKRYTERDGLSNDIIYGILGDDEGNLWLSTNNGLSKFNPATEIFQSYYEGEGLQSNQFYWGACCNGRNGELFFGGINGFNSFYPLKLKFNNHIPPVYFTDFQIFNKSISIYQNNSPLKKAIEYTKEITLDYDKNVLTFEFVALDYSNPHENKYSYKMENFDKDWVLSGRRNFATYTNLDAGEYVFKVIGSNNDGIWNKNGCSVKLIVRPPFWKTWWFIFLAILIIGGSVTYFILLHIKDLLAVERVRIKLAADLHDNIGSSLTEISILSEIIAKKINSSDTDISKSISMISNNSRNLIDKMSDIVWLVNPKRDSLYDLIIRLEDTYSEILSYTNISFRSQNLQLLKKISLSMEHRQNLYLIFKEAINNAVTHSRCTDIFLDANVKGRILEMTLTDNGKGFARSEDSQGNGLYNMNNRAKIIGGKLEINSLQDNGTIVKFIGNIS